MQGSNFIAVPHPQSGTLINNVRKWLYRRITLTRAISIVFICKYNITTVAPGRLYPDTMCVCVEFCRKGTWFMPLGIYVNKKWVIFCAYFDCMDVMQKQSSRFSPGSRCILRSIRPEMLAPCHTGISFERRGRKGRMRGGLNSKMGGAMFNIDFATKEFA